MRCLLLALVLAQGCGGDKGDPLSGVWLAPAPGGCYVGMNLDTAASAYVSSLGCTLVGGGYGSELEAGAVDLARGGKITFLPKRASCPTSDHAPKTADFKQSNDNSLALIFPSGAVLFKRAPPPNGSASGVALFGCWNGDVFTESPVKDL